MKRFRHTSSRVHVLAVSVSALLLFGAVALGESTETKKNAAAKPSASAAPKDAPASATSTPTSEISWLKYEDGLAKAKKTNKQVLIDFSTGWCGYCKKMDRETFQDPSVIKYIQDNFVAVRIDGDSPRQFTVDGFTTTEKQITKAQYGVSGYPTFWFLESDGEKIGQNPGYLPASQFIMLLQHVKERKYEKKVDVTDSSSQKD